VPKTMNVGSRYIRLQTGDFLTHNVAVIDVLVLICVVHLFFYTACILCFQTTALPGHAKIAISRETLFEDSFDQV